MMISPKFKDGSWDWEDVEVKSCVDSNTLGVFSKKELPAGSFFLVFGNGLSSTWRGATAKLDIHRFIRHNKEIDRRCEVITETVNCEFTRMRLSEVLTDEVLSQAWVADENVKYLIQPAVTLMQMPILVTELSIKRMVDLKTSELPVYVCRIIRAVKANVELRWDYTQLTALNSIMSYRTRDAYINTHKIQLKTDDIKNLVMVKPVHMCKTDYKWVIDENDDAECCNLTMFTWRITDEFMRLLISYGTYDGGLWIDRVFEVYCGSKDIHVFDDDTPNRPLVHRCIDYVDIIRLRNMVNISPIVGKSIVLKLDTLLEDAYKQFDCFISLFKEYREELIRESIRLILKLDLNRKNWYTHIFDRIRDHYGELIEEYRRSALSDRDYDRMVSYIERKVYPVSLETTAKLLGVYADVWLNIIPDMEQRMLYITREEWNAPDTVMDIGKREAMSTWLETLETAKRSFYSLAAAKRAELDVNMNRLKTARARIQSMVNKTCSSENWVLYENNGVFSSTPLNVKTRLLHLTPPIEGGLGITTRIRYTHNYDLHNCTIETPNPSILFKVLMNNAWANSLSSHQYIRADVLERLKTQLQSGENDVNEKLLLMYQTKTPTFNNLMKASIKNNMGLNLHTINITKSVNTGDELRLLLYTAAKRPPTPVSARPRLEVETHLPLPPTTEPVYNPEISLIENAYNSLVYKFWNQSTLEIKKFGEIEQTIPTMSDTRFDIVSSRKRINDIIETLKKLPPDGEFADADVKGVMTPRLLALYLEVIRGKMKRKDVIERYQNLLNKMITYTKPSKPSDRLSLSELEKQMNFYKNITQTTFPDVAAIAKEYEKMYVQKGGALEAARKENEEDTEESGSPPKRQKLALAAPGGAAGLAAPVSALAAPGGALAAPGGALAAPVRVSRMCLEQYRELANLNVMGGRLVELGARLYMNKTTGIIDRMVITPQTSTITSWEDEATIIDEDGMPDYNLFGQIHSHVAAWTCFMSRKDIMNQRSMQKLLPNSIMIIYSQNCGGPSENVEGRYGKVQLDKGPPNYDGFKAYTLRRDIVDMSNPEFDSFIERYDETSAYQRVYMAANWQVVDDAEGQVRDMRLIDGGATPAAMSSVLRELGELAMN